MGDLESTSTLGMWEQDGAKKKDNTPQREKKSRNRLHITSPAWIITSVRYLLALAAKALRLCAESWIRCALVNQTKKESHGV